MKKTGKQKGKGEKVTRFTSLALLFIAHTQKYVLEILSSTLVATSTFKLLTVYTCCNIYHNVWICGKCGKKYIPGVGDWIGCDCVQCDKWYHFQCVAITDAPTGSWFCDQCNA